MAPGALLTEPEKAGANTLDPLPPSSPTNGGGECLLDQKASVKRQRLPISGTALPSSVISEDATWQADSRPAASRAADSAAALLEPVTAAAPAPPPPGGPICRPAAAPSSLAEPPPVEPDAAAAAHAAAAWAHFRKLGSPRFHVAPMVDQSELPFRMLCRRYGAEAAYTPMLHARLFVEEPKYRSEFTTCPEDRPLFVQFCANDPDMLLAAAQLVAPVCDYVDINLGCPQRIARRGNYGAFLMDRLPLVRRLVARLAAALPVPVSCKIRIFPDLSDTLAYARMLESAGCSLLAVHGRTREQKNGKAVRADWDAVRAVKRAVAIPVLANGNVRWREDAEECMRYTGADGGDRKSVV